MAQLAAHLVLSQEDAGSNPVYVTSRTEGWVDDKADGAPQGERHRVGAAYNWRVNRAGAPGPSRKRHAGNTVGIVSSALRWRTSSDDAQAYDSSREVSRAST